MTNVKGIAASSGYAIAKAYKLDMPDLTVTRTTVEDTEAEIALYNKSVAAVKLEIAAIKEAATKNLSEEEAAVFDAHAQILEDPELQSQVEAKINGEKLCAPAALEDVANLFITMFSSMDDAYFKERAADVRDVTTRLKANLLGKSLPNPALIDEEVVIIAHDLTPSDTAQLNKNLVRGFITDIGGRTSHSAILARSMEIPAVVATNVITETVNDGDIVVLDGLTGDVFVNPDEETVSTYEAKRKEFEDYKAELKTLKTAESVSTDGHKVLLVANIGSPNDIEAIKQNGAEGVGLFRTEFLYMDRDAAPTEEEQFEAYKTVLEKANGKQVVIRTLDIGGDKVLPYLPLPEEMNPFLGYRAIRLCLDRKEIFTTQLRALYRASVHGKLRIMFPMISSLEELLQAKATCEEVKAQLDAEGIAYSKEVEIGMMIEVPSAAVISDVLAKHVDFFSIGTNDLIQYTCAVDRMNQKISYLYNQFNPAVLRLIKMVIENAHKEGKWVGMCGEAAGDQKMIPILLGFGLDEFSMSPISILPARKLINSVSQADMKAFSDKVLELGTAKEIEAFIAETFNK